MRITDEIRAAVVEAWRRGDYAYEIAQRLGIDPTTVSKIAHAAGEPKRTRGRRQGSKNNVVYGRL